MSGRATGKGRASSAHDWPEVTLAEAAALRKRLYAQAGAAAAPLEPFRPSHDHRGRALIDISDAPSAMEVRMAANRRDA